MTRSRISMVVAAAGLVLVGLLAAALFSPGKTEPTEDKTANDDIQPIEDTRTERMQNPLGYEINVPPIQRPPVEKPVEKEEPVTVVEEKPKPKADPKPETKDGIVEHTIQRGDMISKLAVQYGVKVTDIYAVNDGLDASNANRIRVGQVIRIPVGEKGAQAVANAGDTNPQAKPASGDGHFPRRVVMAEAGDTAFSLAIEHYGARNLFRLIIDANPDLPWSDRLKGGEQVVLPEVGKSPVAENSRPAGSSVERSSLIPAPR